MTKSDETRARIIQQAANLFNQKGYAGVSMSDIMTATGLKKGGIYNHFASKDELAIAAFDYAARQVSQRYMRDGSTPTAVERLKTMIQTFCTTPDEIELKGGCPLMNTAIESDDAHPGLRAQTQRAMDRWRRLIHRIVKQGIQSGELSPTTKPETVATIVIATLEGALMLTKLYGDRVHLQRAEEHLNHYVNTLHHQSD
jgi:AcrR family transcriptional regulator